ncbi:hypothetical protein ScPMuIL_006577 [Solemya velum]
MPSVSVDSNARHTDSQYVNVPKAEGYVPRNHVALQDTTEAYDNARHTDSQYVNVPKAEGYVPRNHVALQDTTEAYDNARHTDSQYVNVPKAEGYVPRNHVALQDTTEAYDNARHTDSQYVNVPKAEGYVPRNHVALQDTTEAYDNARHTDSQYVNVPKAEGYVPRNHVALQDTTEAYDNARHTDSQYVNVPKAEGYVPRNHVALQDTIEAYDWLVEKVDRKEAERGLMTPGNPPGTFLVRESKSCPGNHVLSVLNNDPAEGLDVIHYRIQSLDNGGCYLKGLEFRGIYDLVDHYKSQDGLCVKLSAPCPRIRPVKEDLSPDTKDAREIPRDSLQLEHRLGSGKFGKLCQGKWNKNTAVAITTLKEGTMTVEAFLEVTKIMKECRHDKLVRLYAVCSRGGPLYIVTELMPHGNLLSYLREGKGKNLPLTPLVDMAVQIANGMSYLESKKYIHRYLAAKSILVGEYNEVKVADFHHSRALNEDDEYNPQSGELFPVKWTAPEAALCGKFTTKSDVWSYGILLFELITHGQEPYQDMDDSEVVEWVERGNRMLRPHNFPNCFYDIMRRCWKKNPEDRPTFEYLYNCIHAHFISTEPMQ